MTTRPCGEQVDALVQIPVDRFDAHGIVGDISKKDDIHPIAMQIVGALGGLDVLINNASDLGPVPLDVLDASITRWLDDETAAGH